MIEINLENWKRKEHYLFFSRMDYPHFNICFDIDITNLIPELKKTNLPFYYTMIYLSTISANEIIEFKYRQRNDKIILHEKINPAFTYMSNNSDLFKMIVTSIDVNLTDFVNHTKEKAENQKEHFNQNDFIGKDDYIYITSIPWIEFTHISHTIKLDKNDSVPRISWGKYYENGSRILLPYSVQVNHAFVDGIHISKYKEILEQNIKNI
jgi:chloramphenicol O-acetyltransferase type A